MSELFPNVPEPPPPPPPRPATAVVLWRRSAPGDGTEVFWVRRGERLAHAGGFYAFPGGKTDPDDRLTPVRGADGDAAAALASACRELFEETGVLLADGAERIAPADREAARRALLDGGQRFSDLVARHGLVREGLVIDARCFVPAGRWVTPPFLPARFDAQFFLVEMPGGQQASVWPGELADGEWIDCREAFARWEDARALLHPPIRWVVECLARDPPQAALPRLLSPPYCEGGVTRRIDFQKGLYLVPLRTPTLPPATHTNAYLVDLGDGLAIVDPGASAPEEQARLDRIVDELAAEGKPPREVWLTHHHRDHQGGVGPLAARGLPVYAHARTLDRALAPIADGRPLEDGALMRGRWRALHTPGHARGHLAFLDEQTGALLCGDMVSTLSTIVIDPPEGDMAEYVRQLARLRALEPRTLYPAHGPPAPNAVAALDAYLAHRAAREGKVLAALPGTLAEVTARAYQDTPAFMHPAAERSCLAALEKLRSEGRALCEEQVWTAAS
jgi:glyoxylase-like metal-dependent hydrolase (beta-lactamase superfamily II)/8-oxo-dGTP pyrophosphatase MutT (NUDIX family)